jgi:macrophage erythroblast attacher
MPMAFPNGYVYSREVSWILKQYVYSCLLLTLQLSKALEEMAAKNDGMVTCPRSDTTCQFSELRKVFIS